MLKNIVLTNIEYCNIIALYVDNLRLKKLSPTSPYLDINNQI